MNQTAEPAESRKLLEILSDFEHNIVVRACAGSGKTRLLAAKYLTALFLKGGPANIVAVTFTEKAAQELKGRIHHFLDCIAQAASQKALRQDNTLPWLEIEAALAGRGIAFNAALQKKAEELGEAIASGMGAIGTIHSFARRILDAYPMEAVGGLLTRFDPKSLAIKELLEELSGEITLETTQALTQATFKQVQGLLQELLECAKRGFPAESAVHFDQEALASQKMAALWPRLTKLIDEVIERSRQEGYLDYDLILYWLNQFLQKATPALLESVQGRAKYILLDELQDTDPLQFEIIARLCAVRAAMPIEDWRKLKFMQGRIFMVGDPFQSIYSFRGACPRLAFGKDLLQNFQQWNLLGNKRSGPQILRFVNTVFKEDSNFEPMESGANKDPGPGSVLWHKIEPNATGPARGTHSDRRRLEAAHSAGIILDLAAQEGLRWGDFCILLRKRINGWVYLDELKSLGIPAVLTNPGAEILGRSLVVRALYWLLKLYFNPEDANALHFLRHFPLHENLNFNSDKKEFKEIRSLLGERAGMGEIIWLMQKTFELDQQAQRLGAEETQALEALKDLSWDFKERSVAFLKYLENTLTASRDNEDNETPNWEIPWDSDAVKIATIHQAKGLQFPCVILAGIDDWSLKTQSQKLIWNPEDNNAAIVLAGAKDDSFLGSSLAASKILKEQIKMNQMAEEERILYVALTRAQKILVLMEAQTARSRSAPMARIKELLEKAKGVADPRRCCLCQGQAMPGALMPAEEKTTPSHLARSGVAMKNSAATAAAGSAPAALIYASEKEARHNLSQEHPAPAPKNLYYYQSLGRLLHKVMEHVAWTKSIPNEEIERLLNQAVASENDRGQEPPPRAILEANRILRRFFASPLWQKDLALRRVLARELPVAYLQDHSLVVGRIDLIYQQDEKTAVVVDYKTEYRSPEEFKSQGERYLQALKPWAQKQNLNKLRFELISLKELKKDEI